MDELKPCPFCGGKGKISFKDYAFKYRRKPIITDWLIDPHPYLSKWWNEKSRNEKQTEMFEPYVTSAIEAWNRRVNDEG